MRSSLFHFAKEKLRRAVGENLTENGWSSKDVENAFQQLDAFWGKVLATRWGLLPAQALGFEIEPEIAKGFGYLKRCVPLFAIGSLIIYFGGTSFRGIPVAVALVLYAFAYVFYARSALTFFHFVMHGMTSLLRVWIICLRLIIIVFAFVTPFSLAIAALVVLGFDTNLAILLVLSFILLPAQAASVLLLYLTVLIVDRNRRKIGQANIYSAHLRVGLIVLLVAALAVWGIIYFAIFGLFQFSWGSSWIL